MKEIPPDIHSVELYVLTHVLVVAADKMLRTKGSIVLSGDPEIREKRIVQFGKRMRVDGLEKFGDRTVFSVIYFYRDKSNMDKHHAMGSLIVYIPLAYISKLMHMLDYPRIEEEDEPLVLDACGTVANLLGGYFVKEMAGLGYIHLEMSPFESYINTAVNGLEFSADQEWKSEVSLVIGQEKRMVLELSMAPVPRY